MKLWIFSAKPCTVSNCVKLLIALINVLNLNKNINKHFTIEHL